MCRATILEIGRLVGAGQPLFARIVGELSVIVRLYAVYRVIVDAGPNPDAYVVLQTKPGGKRISIVDWAGTSEGVLRLVSTLVEATRDQSFYLWTNSVPPTLTDGLEALSFGVVKRPMRGMLVRELASGPLDSSDFTDRASWDLRMIASDEY